MKQRTVSPADGHVFVERPLATAAEIEAAQTCPGTDNAGVGLRARARDQSVALLVLPGLMRGP